MSAGVVAVQAGPNNEDPEICAATAKKALVKFGITPKDYTSEYIDILQTPNGMTITTDVFAWFKVKQCPTGHVVVQMYQYCRVSEIHTRGGCKIKGIPDY